MIEAPIGFFCLLFVFGMQCVFVPMVLFFTLKGMASLFAWFTACLLPFLLNLGAIIYYLCNFVSISNVMKG